MMLVKIAWRNIWRNRRRTIITLLALGLGVMAIVTLHSVREGAHEEMIQGVTKGLVGHIQVHGSGYQQSPDINTVVAETESVEKKIAVALPGAEVEARVIGAGLAGSGDITSPVVVMGVDVANPSTRSLLAIEKGRAFGTSAAHEAVLGTGLASELGVEPGGELVLIGQAVDGSLANDLFTVVGTVDVGSSEANASTVFLELTDAQTLFALGKSVHQIIVRLPHYQQDLGPEVSALRGTLDQAKLEVVPWNEILPELKGAMDAKAKNSRLIDLIVFLIVSLGVLNTTTMSTFERTREFGVLRSLGTRPRRILGMVVLETLLQGVIGFVAGLSLAWVLLHGIGTVDFSSIGGGVDVLGARLPDAMRLTVHTASVLSAALITVLTMLAGGLIPAIRASRLKPVEAMRYV